MDLKETGRIWYTQSGTVFISGSKKDQYGVILWGSTKPQASRPQENSLCVNQMPGINTEILIDFLDTGVIK